MTVPIEQRDDQRSKQPLARHNQTLEGAVRCPDLKLEYKAAFVGILSAMPKIRIGEFPPTSWPRWVTNRSASHRPAVRELIR